MKTVARAGRSLMIEEPFYGFYLLNLNKKFSEELPTAGVYKEGLNMALAINEEWWKGLSENHQLGILKHELLHICMFHLELQNSYGDKALFNIAADIEINQYIKKELLPKGNLHLNMFPTIALEAFKGTHYYYEKLQKNLSLPKKGGSGQGNKDGQKKPKKGEGESQCQGKSGGSQPNPMGQPGQGNGQQNKPSKYRDEVLDRLHGSAQKMHGSWDWYKGLSSAEKKLMKQQIDHLMKEAVRTAKKSVGNIPGELKEYIDKLFEKHESVFNWKAYLRRLFGGSQEIYTKKTRKKLSKRFEGNPGLKIKKKKHILFAVDTSGSMAKKELQEAFSEVYHVWKTGAEVTIIECDARVGDIYKYNGKFRGHVTGGGGTVFDPVIKHYNENIHKYTICVYFTDGYGSTSTKPLKHMVWVISSNGRKEYSELPGQIIQIPSELA